MNKIRAVTTEKLIEAQRKENAELKLKLEALEGQTPWKDIKDKSELIGKLTKATEIIREVAESHSYFDILEAQKKAEAFLKE